MNKDELKDKADRLKERIKETFGDTKKKAEGSVEDVREAAHEKTDEVQSDKPKVDVPRDDEDE